MFSTLDLGVQGCIDQVIPNMNCIGDEEAAARNHAYCVQERLGWLLVDDAGMEDSE